MDHDTLSLVQANQLAERIAEARRLRDAGASPEEIEAIEPTREECRAVLLALRTNRTAVAAATKPKRKKALKSMSLMELLGADKSQETS